MSRKFYYENKSNLFYYNINIMEEYYIARILYRFNYEIAGEF